MSSPTPDQFEAFYKAVNGKDADPNFGPFPWQERLAARVCGGDWPRAIALPTAAGKTACIDIAVFALACGADFRQPRRIFFVVDRRIVVDQAWMHATKLARVLDRATDGVVRDVADRLREIAEPGWLQLSPNDRLRILRKRWAIRDSESDAERRKLLEGLTLDERQWFEISPLDVYALRGGMYRESAWARTPLQPTVIASTVDQVGSRLLFRGYGVSDSMKPVHAGLVGNDSLILLDEAHCAKPFDQTMQAVEQYRTWGEKNEAPLRFVSITATPSGGLPKALIERAAAEDLAHPVLGARIRASKPARLVVAEKAKGKTWRQWGKPLVEKLMEQAKELATEFACVGIIVNRVATARELAKRLGAEAVLLTGRMRPLDRDRLFTERLQPLLSGASGDPPKFVVGTQCLECGADFDFHALVTECASLDALRQRFGRLNRVADRSSAKAVVVIRSDQTEPEEKETDRDPVYDNALANTWNWLNANAKDGVFDFGVSAVNEVLRGVSDKELSELNAPSLDAPVLFPAHLDCWVQTHPIPTPDPDPALFLHGPKQAGKPDVQVVFRADLGDNSDLWAEIVALCPPSSSEAVAVPIGVLKKWMTDELLTDDTADVEGGTPEEKDEREEEPTPGERIALRWKGSDSDQTLVLTAPSDEFVRPGDLFVVPCSAPGVDGLGDFPFGSVTDYAEEAFQRSRDKSLLRLPDLVIPEDASKDEEIESVIAAIERLRELPGGDLTDWRKRAADHFANPKNLRRCEIERHPLGGFVITGKKRLGQFDPTYLEDSEPAESFRGVAVTLKDHSAGVAWHAERFAKTCGLDSTLFTQAGLWHDLGKLDPRFQAMLRQSSPRTVVGDPLAKSARSPRTEVERDEARQVHKYPKGARHELLSVALVTEKVGADKVNDLLLHLIATHHGSARPFAPPVDENGTAQEPFKTAPLFGETFELKTAAQKISEWNAELPERFWRVVRKYGWWGAAYHEAVFRLADHTQSATEQELEVTPAPDVTAWVLTPTDTVRPGAYSLPLTGLDGSNPLAFLAALGTLMVCDQLSHSAESPDWLRGCVALSWGDADSPNTPILNLCARPPSPIAFAQFLADHLRRTPEIHSMAAALAILEQEESARPPLIRPFHPPTGINDRDVRDWLTALLCETNPAVASQLQTVRRDYLIGNIRSVMQRTEADHLRRSLFEPWDYADSLNNQSLHWEPSEDRRHAYQWLVPTNSRSRETGGMLGANRLALEAWPLFPSFPEGGDRVRTRGFRGNRVANTYWIWPLWTSRLTPDGVAPILSLSKLQSQSLDANALRCFGVRAVYQSQRILVGKTPNLTPTRALV